MPSLSRDILSFIARVAKLVDAPDLGSGVLRRVGSSPITRTMRQKRNFTTKNSSFFVVKSTMPTAVGQTKYGRSSYHLGRDKTTLSIKKTNRQCEQQKVRRSTAPVVPRGLRKASVVNYGKHTQEEIGISLSVLNNYFCKLVESDEPIYKNKKCTIRKGTLYVKPTTRGRKKQGE